MQASNVTVGASALATSASLQLTASLVNSIGSDKLCCLGQAFAAIVDAEIANGTVAVRVQSCSAALLSAGACCGGTACSDAACFCFCMGWLVHSTCTGRYNSCIVPC